MSWGAVVVGKAMGLIGDLAQKMPWWGWVLMGLLAAFEVFIRRMKGTKS